LIDAGEPSLPYDMEPAPANGRVNIGAYGNTNVASMSGLPFDVVLVPDTDSGWVYQNAPASTGNRHHIVLAVQVPSDPNSGNSAYWSQVTKTGGAGDLLLTPDGVDPMLWYLIGSQHGVGATGFADLKVKVLADLAGGGVNTMTVKVRLLGDVNDDGDVTGADQLEINRELNDLSVSPGIEFRDLDLTGDGLDVTGADQLIVNRIVNDLPVE